MAMIRFRDPRSARPHPRPAICAGAAASKVNARGRSITPSRTSVSVIASSVSAPAMPGSASANGNRLSSGPRGSWPDAMTIDRSVGNRSAHRLAGPLRCATGGDRRAKVRKPVRGKIRQHEMRRRNAACDGSRVPLPRRIRSSAARGRHLPEMQPRTGHFRQRNIARDRQRFGLGRGGGQAQRVAISPAVAAACPVRPPSSAWDTTTRSSIAAYCSSRSIVPLSAIQRRPVATPRAPASCIRPISASSLARQLARRGAERVDPQIGLAAFRDIADPAWQIERRGLVRHQRGAGDAAEMERRLVDREHAEIDQAGRNMPARSRRSLRHRSPGATSPIAAMRAIDQPDCAVARRRAEPAGRC